MMKLYYSAGSCSTSCHISLEESGLKYEAISMDWDKDTDAKTIEKLNPLGTLPIAMIDDKHVLSQNLAIHEYIAELAPAKNLLPKHGTFEHAEAMNWLSFVAADLHKAFAPLFALQGFATEPQAQEQAKKYFVGGVNRHLKVLDERLQGRDYILGKNFSVVDSYCFVVTGWSQWLEIDLKPYKNISNYVKRVSERPAVHKVLKEEGLLD
jgi:glutathione S-transferase